MPLDTLKVILQTDGKQHSAYSPVEQHHRSRAVVIPSARRCRTMGTYRSRRIRASVREHLADAGIGLVFGTLGALILYLITLAVVAQLGVSI